MYVFSIRTKNKHDAIEKRVKGKNFNISNKKINMVGGITIDRY